MGPDNFMKILFFLFIFLVNSSLNFANEVANEFVLPKKKENLSVARLKDSILKKFGDILHANINLDEVSIELRKFILEQTESGINGENINISNANKNQLKETLDELKKIEDELNIEVKSLKNKLSKLKKKFNIN